MSVYGKRASLAGQWLVGLMTVGVVMASLAWSASAQPSASPSSRQASPPAQEKVLRYAFRVAETGFDPAQLSDLYSRILTANIFDALYAYDYLARPAKLVPNIAEGMPEVSADFKTFTVRIRQGIYFDDDPAFVGKKRELTAADYVYSFKRIADPKNKSPVFSSLTEEKIIGMAALRRAAEAPGARFDYDTEIEGLRALDRYTLQFKLEQTRPRFVYTLADPGVLGAVAREVVEKYGDKIMEHPVGTGAFKLAEWKRSSKISFVRNPNFREQRYEADPPADSPEAQATYQRLKGRRLPLVDRVEIYIIEENQPRWLAFLGQEHDLLERLPEQVANLAIPNNQLAPNLAKKGIVMERVPVADVTLSYFAMEHPVVGGYTPDKVALRRAIALGYNAGEEVRLPRRNQAIVAQGPVQPTTYGYDPAFRSEMGLFDRARALALLDMYGYVDKDGDGWRDMPDGKPLVLEYSTQPDDQSRELTEIWKRNMDALQLKMVFKVAKWPENLKASRAGKLMMWGVAMSASSPDGGGILDLGYSRSIGGLNHARFRNEQFDALVRRQALLPNGEERLAAIREATKLMVAYMPYKFSTHRFVTDMTHPWVIGYHRHPTAREFWKHVDIDTARQPR
jgi:ABC-type transport system substrate-binding protein